MSTSGPKRSVTRLRILLPFVGLTLLAGIAWLVVDICHQPSAVYMGKPLSVWVADYEFGKRSPEADEAVRAIGADALPTLMRMLRATDSPLRLWLVKLSQKQKLITLNYTPAETQHMRSVLAFRALGARAKSVVPELVRMYEQAPTQGPWGPGEVLGEIGPDASAAIPALLANVTSTNQGARELAVAALGKIHAEPELVVPELIRALGDVSPVRYQVVCGLGRYGSAATNAAPALIKLMKAPNSNYRSNIAGALKDIGVPTETIVSALIECLGNTNYICRFEAVMALKNFGPRASEAIPNLQQLQNDEDNSLRELVGQVLTEVRSE